MSLCQQHDIFIATLLQSFSLSLPLSFFSEVVIYKKILLKIITSSKVLTNKYVREHRRISEAALRLVLSPSRWAQFFCPDSALSFHPVQHCWGFLQWMQLLKMIFLNLWFFFFFSSLVTRFNFSPASSTLNFVWLL